MREKIAQMLVSRPVFTVNLIRRFRTLLLASKPVLRVCNIVTSAAAIAMSDAAVRMLTVMLSALTCSASSAYVSRLSPRMVYASMTVKLPAMSAPTIPVTIRFLSDSR